ncbi:MAG: glycosyltransferase family 39 protein [Candidatus Promineofilum sp.]|nr:glycosyltransferase family 39 protein [Promineifilum sp.]
MRFVRQPLWLVLAAFVLLCAIYVWSIPPLEGSDEYEHFAYVTWLIEQRTFPIQGEAGWYSSVRQESGQPPLYYWLASLPARLVGTQPPLVFRPNPYFRYDLNPTVPDNRNTALHYPADTGGGWRALRFARIASVASGVLLILCIYGLARAIFPDRPGAPLAAAAFVAFIPQVVFHSSHVSNDILAAAFSALALWMLVRIMTAATVEPGVNFKSGLWLGAALGLAALVKVNTLVIGLPVALGFVWLLWDSIRSGQPQMNANAVTGRIHLSTLTPILICASGAALGFAAVAGWWFVRSRLLYGSFLGLDTHCYQELSTCGPIRLVMPNLFAWRDTFRSFWAAFGLANIRPHDWVYGLFAKLILLAGAGLLLLVARRMQAGGRDAAAAEPHLPILLTLMASAVAGNLLLLYIWQQQILATYGRLLYPVLGAFVVLLIAGLWELHPRLVRWAWLLPAVLAVISPFWLIRPAYAMPRFLDEAAVAARGESLDWRYGDVAELLSITPASRSASAGDILPIEICWRTLSATDTNYTVYLQAVGPHEAVVADRYTFPGLGSYPTAIWEPGVVFCDTVQLPIPADLARTLVYRLSVGLLDDAIDVRLPGVDPAGNPLPPFVGAVWLESRSATMNEQPPPGDAPIRLGGADFVPVWRAGEGHPVTLRWYAAEAVATDYTVFLHLRDDAGQIVAQADGPPLEGWYPTSWWVTGEWVIDEHAFALPTDTPPGNYRLVTGLYDPTTGGRLGDEQLLGSVEVVAGTTP